MKGINDKINTDHSPDFSIKTCIYPVQVLHSFMFHNTTIQLTVVIIKVNSSNNKK
jgi:hypothetical protein